MSEARAAGPTPGWRQRVLSLTGSAMLGVGLHRWLLRDRAVVVAFHRVNDETAGDGLTVGTREFEAYCRLFARSFRVVPLSEVVRKLECGESFSGELAITFDDGYLDNYERAAPILKRHGLPACFFVTTTFLESKTVPWWDEEMPTPPRWMSWDQVRSLQDMGFEIGAHTRTHADLGEIGGAEAELEIAGARAELSERLGRNVDLFAYPYGRPQNLSEDNRAIARASGFRCCASCFGGLADRGSDPFALRRVAVSSWYTSASHFGLDLVRENR